MATQISRDPFARTTLVRDRVSTDKGCDFCGSRLKRPHLYRYGTEPDRVVPRVNWHKGVFCSKSCHDSYHF